MCKINLAKVTVTLPRVGKVTVTFPESEKNTQATFHKIKTQIGKGGAENIYNFIMFDSKEILN